MSSGRSTLKLAENTSATVVRIEAPSFKSKHGPLGLFCLWLVVLIVSFVVGANGPAVLSNHGAGHVVNSSTMVNFTEVPNGTIATFHLHPTQYKQFFSLRLRMRHPGALEGYSPVVKKNQDVEYIQTWAIAGIEHHGAHVAENHEGLSLERAHMHHSRIVCRAENDLGHDKDWCDGQHIYGTDHVRPVGYFFKIFIHRAPAWLVPPSFYDDHSAQFDIRVVTMHPQYVNFEMGFKYFFFVMTLLVAFTPSVGFVYMCSTIPQKALSSSHHWIAAMIGGLLFFNEPLMAVRVGVASAANVLGKLQMVTATGFIAYLMYYWLVLLDDSRLRAQAQKSRGAGGMTAMDIGGAPEPVANPFNFYTKSKEETLAFAMFYFPKMGLVGVIWALVMGTYATVALETEFDPSFQPYDSSDNGGGGLAAVGLKALMIATIVLMVFYLAWVAVLLAWTCALLPHIGHAYRWLGALSVFTLALVAAGVLVGVAYPVPSSSVIFLGFYGMINVYVWIMAIAWTPLPAESLESTVEMTENAFRRGGAANESNEGASPASMDIEDEVDFSTKEMV